jgi:hypothetical protein
LCGRRDLPVPSRDRERQRSPTRAACSTHPTCPFAPHLGHIALPVIRCDVCADWAVVCVVMIRVR